MDNNKKKKTIILVSIISIITLLGVAYAWFNYYKATQDQKLIAGDIYLTLNNNTNQISLTNMFPMTKEEARARNDNTISFTLSGKNTSENTVYYEIKLNHGDDKTGYTRFNDSDLVFDLVEVGNNNEETYLVDAKSYDSIEEKRIWVDTVNPNTTTEITKTYKLRVWLSEDIIISDTEPTASYPATGTNAFKNHFATVKATVFGDFQEKETPLSGSQKVLRAIDNKIHAETNSCNPIWIDDNGTTSDESDDITYFSGTNDCVDMNYVWYSGKLWRITAIYPDGAMKLITENNITSIAFNESGNINFENSYIYQWLNEEFYETLYRASEFIDTSKKWNATIPEVVSLSSKPGETTLVTSNIGLLNSYEYYNSYRNLGDYSSAYSAGFLNIKYYWWLLNSVPNPSSNDAIVWFVDYDGTGITNIPNDPKGVRPSIYLKSELEFTGSGTANDPYRIVGDKNIGVSNDLINTRISGEYVKLKNGNDEQLFRIIGVEDNKTKIIEMNYANNKATKKFATGNYDTLWGSGTTTDTDTWYTYLNNTYLPNLKTTYGELFDSNTYYFGTSGINYKLSVCANTTSGNTKVCTKTSQSGTLNIGLPYYGEMFSTQQSGGYSESIRVWLLNPSSSVYGWRLDKGGSINNFYSSTAAYGARPTLHLKPTVKILNGSGTESDPYVVGL